MCLPIDPTISIMMTERLSREATQWSLERKVAHDDRSAAPLRDLCVESIDHLIDRIGRIHDAQGRMEDLLCRSWPPDRDTFQSQALNGSIDQLLYTIDAHFRSFVHSFAPDMVMADSRRATNFDSAISVLLSTARMSEICSGDSTLHTTCEKVMFCGCHRYAAIVLLISRSCSIV